MKPNNYWNIEKLSEDADKFHYITLFMQDVYNILNNGIIVGDNLKGQTITVTFGQANTNLAFSHKLQYAPSNYIVLNLSDAMIVYDGTTANTRNLIYLRSSATGTATLLIF